VFGESSQDLKEAALIRDMISMITL